MTFENIIARVASTPHVQKNIITDGRSTCTYQEIPDVFESIDKFLLASGIDPTCCLALECVNSVPGALTLLYLLTKGYRFALLPPAGGKGKDFHFQPLVPKFCQYRVTIQRPSNRESGEAELQPAHFLVLEKHAPSSARQDQVSQTRGTLYLRTSGSVGVSKIAVHAHAKLLGNAFNCVTRFQLAADDRVAIPIPIFHMYGLGAAFLPAVMVGASIDLQDQANILTYLERERHFNPNVAFLTPAFCEMFLQGRSAARAHKRVVTAGQRIKEETFRAFDARFGPLVNLYGSTEMGAIAASEAEAPLEVRATTIGKPMPEVQLRVDAHQTETAGAMPPGELSCHHPYGFEAYVDDQGATISQAAEWFRTGDMATIHANGYVEVLGRGDHSVNRRGFLVLFSDIEKAMEKIEPLAQVVVVPAKGEDTQGQRLAAFCVPRQGAMCSDTHIRTACFHVLPHYAIPDQVFVVNALPTLPSGKVDRQALADLAG